jgi:hypothetical protein
VSANRLPNVVLDLMLAVERALTERHRTDDIPAEQD